MLERYSSDESVGNFLRTLSYPQKEILFGVINLNTWNLEISWDFDQVLIESQSPVFEKADKDFGTHYKGRKVISWSSVAEWLVEDGKMHDFEKAKDYEEALWNDPDIIAKSPVNRRLQALSFVAWQRGIRQTISTSRPPALEEVTKLQVEKYFPWLIGHVNQRTVKQAGVNGKDGINFKVRHVSELYQGNHNLVHLDDSMVTLRKLLQLHPNMNVFGFPATKERFSDLIGGQRIFFPDIALFESLVVYSPKLPYAL